MKKIFMALLLVLACNLVVFAAPEDHFYDMNNLWQKNGKYEQKVLTVGYNILNKNNIPKNISIKVDRKSVINAYAIFLDKSVKIEKGLFPYIDNDDELAAVLSHEIAHTLDMHASFPRQLAMVFAPVRYETKADLVGVDLMTKAGYNPLAMITFLKKIAGEHFDFGSTHPRGSKRIKYVYNHIKKYYPIYLNSPQYKKNVYYINAMKIIKYDKSSPYGTTTMDIENVVLKEKKKRAQISEDL